jgi:membrane-bound serine protease (ClpP class)
MRSEMRSTAERNGRRKDIAEGMVDETVKNEELNPNGDKLLSLTFEEARQYGICDTVLNDAHEMLVYIGAPEAPVIYTEMNWAEKAVGFLNQPFVSSFLIIIGLIGIFTEFKSPGLGVPVIAGIIAFALFFGSSYLLQLASIWQIALFIIGLGLLALEIFVIPGFGVAGVIGIGLMIGSIFFSLFSNGPDMSSSIHYAIIQLSFTLLITIALFALLIRFLPKSDRFKWLTLQTSNASDKGFVSSNSYVSLIGKQGQTVTALRPAGVVLIEGEKYDVIADGDYINKGEQVSLVVAEGSKIIVRRLPKV